MAGSDKFPYFAAETGTYYTSAPNPHINLSGVAVNLGDLFAARTFAAAAADANVDFDNGDTCQVYIVEDGDPSNALIYAEAVWNDASPDNFDLSAATLKAAVGTISDGTAVVVIAQQPEGRALPDAEGAAQGSLAQVDASGDWTI